ncbi:MAG: glycerol-3-phosphate acyltransferase [Anaerolineales bacterium]
MQTFQVMLLGYLLGSIPFGFILVKLATGKDLRGEHSGRTGGTNARRVGGRWVGAVTGILDALKGYFSVRIAMWLLPGDIWASVLAPLATILGHNYSLFLMQKDENGRWRLSGGAGGAPTLGGAMGLWLPSLFIMLPAGILVFYFIGYASVTTLSAGVMALIIFGARAALGLSPWPHVVYGGVSLLLLTWSLRPNIKRLREGTERLHGYRARKEMANAER